MLCTSFRSKISHTATLSSSLLRTQARHPVTSSVPLLRRYATRKASPGVKISPPRPRPPPQGSVSSPQMRTGLPPANPQGNSGLKKAETAKRLFEAGDKILYRATSRTTFFRVNSWAIALVAGLGAAALSSHNFLDVNTLHQSGHEYPIFIVVSNTAAFVFFGVVIALSLRRSRNHIHSIHLIQQSGKVQLQVTYRSIVPFMKESFVVQPHDFTVNDPFGAVSNLPESLIPSAPSESSPAAFTAGVVRETFKSISRLFYSIFDNFRAYLLSHGLFEAEIVQGSKGMKKYTMDASADYLLKKNNLPALWDVVKTKDPYDWI